MKKANIIRILSGLMFLIFLCPFFQMCSNPVFLKLPDTNDPIVKEKAREEAIKEFALNGYELSTITYKPLAEEGLPQASELDFGLLPFVSYSILLPLIIILLYVTLRKKFKSVLWTSCLLLFFGILPLINLFFDGIFEDINQIKYGYYLFFINTIAIIVLSTKQICAQNGIRAAYHTPSHPIEDNPGGTQTGF